MTVAQCRAEWTSELLGDLGEWQISEVAKQEHAALVIGEYIHRLGELPSGFILIDGPSRIGLGAGRLELPPGVGVERYLSARLATAITNQPVGDSQQIGPTVALFLISFSGLPRPAKHLLEEVLDQIMPTDHG